MLLNEFAFINPRQFEFRDKLKVIFCKMFSSSLHPQIIFVLLQMSLHTHKNQIQQLSSLSLSQNLKEIRDSQFFAQAARKSSFDIVNMLGESNHINRSKIEKSLDMLNSSIALNKPTSFLHVADFFKLDGNEFMKIEKAGFKATGIDQIDSSSEEELPDEQYSRIIKEDSMINEQSDNYEFKQLLPVNLAQLIMENEIPLEYVRGLLLVNNQKEVKSIRRLKVERYLQKRRIKTWDKKICYNCRQKVAQQRLRIKGKFIKKRRAMQILGLTTPISTTQVKRLLEQLLKDKTLREIQDIIKKEQ